MGEDINDEDKLNESGLNPQNEPILVPEQENDHARLPNQAKNLLSDLRHKLKKCDEEKKEYLLGWQRAKADYINSRKRDEEDNRLQVKFAEAVLLTDLIPVLDSIDVALNDYKTLGNLPEEWKKGMEQIKNQFVSVLKAHNLEAIDPLGKPFDTREAEAVGTISADNPADDGKIMTVVQKGYRLHGRILRPAKVRVGAYSETKNT